MTTRVVQQASDTWSADTVTLTAGTEPEQVASRDPYRVSVAVQSDEDNTGDIYVVPRAGQRTGGYRLKPGGTLSLLTAGAVYAYVPAGVGDQVIYVVGESGGC